LQFKEAQAEPKTPNAVHDAAVIIAGKEIQGKAVFIHRGASRVFLLTSTHRNTGQLIKRASYLNQITPKPFIYYLRGYL